MMTSLVDELRIAKETTESMGDSGHLIVTLALNMTDPLESRCFTNKPEAESLAGSGPGGLHLLEVCQAVMIASQGSVGAAAAGVGAVVLRKLPLAYGWLNPAGCFV
jgi:hypothetical protein